MELVEERVMAGPQRVNHHERGDPGRHHLLHPQGRAFEFRRALPLVMQDDLEALACRHFELRRGEVTIADHQFIGRQAGRETGQG